MNSWIEIKINKYNSKTNFPSTEILVTNGNWVKYVSAHGWDKDNYYFYDGIGLLEGVTHYMPLPKPPKES